MALSILDGNQTATTLSTVLTSGQHITAHTIVSLGTQAITEITGAVSGSVVTIPNLNVLARSVATEGIADGTLNFVKIGGHQDGSNQTAHIVHVSAGGAMKVDASDSTVTFGAIRGTVTIGNSVTISSLPAISGTVTANVGDALLLVGGGYSSLDELFANVSIEVREPTYITSISGTVTIGSALPAGTNRIGVVTIGGGTVTIGAGISQIGSVTASISGTVPISISSVTIGNIRRDTDGATTQLTTETGSAYLLTRSYVGAGTAQIGSVTASLAISSTAITSGSFSSLTSATLVPGNTTRKMATVYNLGAGQLFINQGTSATTLGGGFMVALSSGDFYECDYTTTTLSALFATAGTASWVSH
jgi:hypothetical protein